MSSTAASSLALRLASQLWRLRRATTIETGVFEIQADHLREFRRTRHVLPALREVDYALFRGADSVGQYSNPITHIKVVPNYELNIIGPALDPAVEVARSLPLVLVRNLLLPS
jgi:hypothetical protein